MGKYDLKRILKYDINTKDTSCGDLGPQYPLRGENVTKSHETAGYLDRKILWLL